MATSFNLLVKKFVLSTSTSSSYGCLELELELSGVCISVSSFCFPRCCIASVPSTLREDDSHPEKPLLVVLTHLFCAFHPPSQLLSRELDGGQASLVLHLDCPLMEAFIPLYGLEPSNRIFSAKRFSSSNLQEVSWHAFQEFF